MITLAIETSCDETSAAVLDDTKVISNIIHSQMFHSSYGGVVPEVASREHLKKIVSVTDEALKIAGVGLQDIELVAATSEPGLIGALLVGLNFAKSVSMTIDVPFVPVNHIEAHLYSCFLEGQKKDEFPFMGLIVSGGHTILALVKNFFDHEILGSTIDDAAGEAFDKGAKLLGLGYPGGHLIDELAKSGNRSFHKFPIPVIKNSLYDFSFSGLKTSLLYYLKEIQFENNNNDKLLRDICASYREAIVMSLFKTTKSACEDYNVKIVSVTGGVSANSRLREVFKELEAKDYKVHFPGKEYSTDNAAMIGLLGYYKYNLKEALQKEFYTAESLKTSARARLDYENF